LLIIGLADLLKCLEKQKHHPFRERSLCLSFVFIAHSESFANFWKS